MNAPKVSQATGGLLVVDYRYLQSYSPLIPMPQQTYEVGAKCRNCETEHIAVFGKGQALPAAGWRCPHCEVLKVSFFSRAYAERLRRQAATTATLNVQDAPLYSANQMLAVARYFLMLGTESALPPYTDNRAEVGAQVQRERVVCVAVFGGEEAVTELYRDIFGLSKEGNHE